MKLQTIIKYASILAISAFTLSACIVVPRHQHVSYEVSNPAPPPPVSREINYEYITTAPPPPQVEVVTVAPSPQHIWIKGYWGFNRGRYQWIRGHWERPPHGQYWRPARWEQRNNGWYFQGGYWSR